MRTLAAIDIMKKKRTNKITTKNKFLIGVTIILLLLEVFHFMIEDIFLCTNGHCEQAIISDKVRADSRKKDTYYFKFQVDGKEYFGDSYITDDNKAAIGTKMCIVYLDIFPAINRSIKGYFNNDFKTCDCNLRH
jgi:hypothetical protein